MRPGGVYETRGDSLHYNSVRNITLRFYFRSISVRFVVTDGPTPISDINVIFRSGSSQVVFHILCVNTARTIGRLHRGLAGPLELSKAHDGTPFLSPK